MLKIQDLVSIETLSDLELTNITGGADLRSDSVGSSQLSDGSTMLGNVVVSDYGLVWQTEEY